MLSGNPGDAWHATIHWILPHYFHFRYMDTNLSHIHIYWCPMVQCWWLIHYLLKLANDSKCHMYNAIIQWQILIPLLTLDLAPFSLQIYGHTITSVIHPYLCPMVQYWWEIQICLNWQMGASVRCKMQKAQWQILTSWWLIFANMPSMDAHESWWIHYPLFGPDIVRDFLRLTPVIMWTYSIGALLLSVTLKSCPGPFHVIVCYSDVCQMWMCVRRGGPE